MWQEWMDRQRRRGLKRDYNLAHLDVPLNIIRVTAFAKFCVTFTVLLLVPRFFSFF